MGEEEALVGNGVVRDFVDMVKWVFNLCWAVVVAIFWWLAGEKD